MNRHIKGPGGTGRKIFWCIIGSMSFIAAGISSYTLCSTQEIPGMGEFSFTSFFPALEARTALANSEVVQRSMGSSLAADSPLLPGVPEYESAGFVYDEMSAEEEAPEGWHLSNLPLYDADEDPAAPLAVCSGQQSSEPSSENSANEPEYAKLIESLMGNEDEVEEEDESPWIEHTVGIGERMVDISHKYGILVATISKANNITDPNKLTAGKVLLIPRSEDLLSDVLEEQQARAEAAAEAKRKADLVKFKEYTVKPGDSLWSIANANKLSIDSLYGTNILRNPDRLSPGTVLRIPNQDGICVKVAKGQTLAALAKKYSVPETAIRMANGLGEKGDIKVGQEVFLPGASQAVTAYRSTSTGGGVSKQAPKSSDKAPAGAAGSMSWPVHGKITSPYGWRRHPIRKRRIFHSGMDIGAPRGTPIRAARGGQVIFSGWMNGYGRVIIIRHDSTLTTMYAHCQTLRVSKGANVQKGSIIATVGTSGRATGPHVHFEVRRNDRPANPRNYLR